MTTFWYKRYDKNDITSLNFARERFLAINTQNTHHTYIQKCLATYSEFMQKTNADYSCGCLGMV